jgi:hypothetical protein
MPDIDWDIVRQVAAIELVGIAIFGLISASLVWLRYRSSSESLQLFRHSEYTSLTTDTSQGMYRSPPNWYYFVVVRYQQNHRIASETFYSITGDVIQLRYSEDGSSGSRAYPFSNRVLVSLPLTGFGLLFIARWLSSPVLALVIKNQLEIYQVLTQLGFTLFVSVFIAGPIKMVLDPLLYFGLPRWRSHSE